MQRDAGISHFEYMVLAGLSEAPDRTLRMSDLAVFASGSLSRLSHVVKRLERRGWVRREPCTSDGRSTNAVLTDSGWDKIVATAPGDVETVCELVIEPLTKTQLGHLREMGRRINCRIDLAADTRASVSDLLVPAFEVSDGSPLWGSVDGLGPDQGMAAVVSASYAANVPATHGPRLCGPSS